MKKDNEEGRDSKRRVVENELRLEQLARQLRVEGERVGERGASVLFEAAAEVLMGLKTSFAHFAAASEPAMREKVSR